ncbi:unnamed protein product [Symbiodinium pilosum]|uniref:Uncharacterized protein n=1 Tax=Symbiodinium pilosum TaxID=2952 RepID=A0A812YK81_SYMPI|nr:unnamed protein product [Symbiodinium pilosum]
MASLAMQNHETPLDLVARNLKSERVESRCGALRELGRMGKRMTKRDIEQSLVPMLSDSDAAVQEHALVALSELQGRALDYAPLAATKLEQSRTKEVKRAALLALGSMGPGAASQAGSALSFLNHQDLDLVVDACSALGKMRATNAADAVSAKLSSSDTDVVFAACMSLAEMDCNLQDVGKLLKHSDARVRSAAVNAVKSMTGAESFSSEIVPLLSDSDSYVRLGAADYACRLGPKAADLAVPAGKLLSDSKPGVVAAAAAALGGIGESAASQIPALEQALRNDGEDTSTLPLTVAGVSPKLAALLRKPACAAAAALANMGSAGATSAARLVECLHAKDWEVRVAALHALSKMPAASARYEYHISDMLRDEAPPVAAAACLAVGEIAAATGQANNSTARVVAELMEHPHPTVRARAVQGLGMMGDEAHAHVETFVALFGDRAWNVQAEAIRAVAKCGEIGQMFAPDVCRMTYQGSSPAVQVAACEALARMGPRGACFKDEVSALEDDQSEEVRDAAKKALKFFENSDKGALVDGARKALTEEAIEPEE